MCHLERVPSKPERPCAARQGAARSSRRRRGGWPQVRRVVTDLIGQGRWEDGDPDILVAFDAGCDAPAHDLPPDRPARRGAGMHVCGPAYLCHAKAGTLAQGARLSYRQRGGPAKQNRPSAGPGSTCVLPRPRTGGRGSSPWRIPNSASPARPQPISAAPGRSGPNSPGSPRPASATDSEISAFTRTTRPVHPNHQLPAQDAHLARRTSDPPPDTTWLNRPTGRPESIAERNQIKAHKP